MTDSSGTVVWAADYKPFGEATITVSSITNNLRFPGQYFDAETGLHYNYRRDYNTALGKYIEADPLNLGSIGTRNSGQTAILETQYKEEPQQLNLYTYVASNPLKYVDPFGLSFLVFIPSTKTIEDNRGRCFYECFSFDSCYLFR
jgi:RHS repeat-associated protein